jgi:hypothetical protein
MASVTVTSRRVFTVNRRADDTQTKSQKLPNNPTILMASLHGETQQAMQAAETKPECVHGHTTHAYKRMGTPKRTHTPNRMGTPKRTHTPNRMGTPKRTHKHKRTAMFNRLRW